MAIFGRSANDASIPKKIQEQQYRDRAHLRELLGQLEEGGGFEAKKHLWMLSHPERDVRGFAGRCLETTADRSTIDALIKEMTGKNASIRKELASLTVRIGEERLPRFLGPMIHSRRVEQREVALELLSALPKWFEHASLLKDALKDPVASIRRQTVTLLKDGAMYPKVFQLLKGLIHEPDDTIRHQVIETLARVANPEIVEPFFERLEEETPQIRRVMTSALSRLVDHPDAKLEHRLLPMLSDESPVLRDAAVSLLREMRDPKKILRSYLVHSRGQAFWLRERGREQILRVCDSLLDSLIELMHDPEPDICVGAMLMAAEAQDDRILPHVVEIFESEHDWWIRSLAADVMVRFRTTSVLRTLVGAMGDSELRYSVISALGQLRTVKAIPFLVECLKDSSRGIRMATLDALAVYDDIEVMEALFETATTDAEEAVRDKAVVVLESFGEKSQDLLARIDHSRNRGESDEDEDSLVLEMQNETLNRVG